jgi:hypothetical protein
MAARSFFDDEVEDLQADECPRPTHAHLVAALAGRE